ncbi:MAG: DUF29 domain-containing protein [Geminicoccaceae bacterium]|nr:DUF29 domain-containing protein [Geminicoccaceae bacterium]MDW8369136.1 DUF29 domain-containing protein [Geminicoccaceae bacterium]
MKATSELAALDPAELYERDFYAWTRQQARALARLRGGAGNLGLDPAHLAEEIRDLGSEQRHAIESQLERLIEHLLKLEYSQLAEPRRVWGRSVIGARDEIERRLTPSIARLLARRLAKLYGRARRNARLALLDHPEPEVAVALPETCPYTLEQLLDDGWYPTNRHGLPSPEAP